jgi:hypothetical protein
LNMYSLNLIENGWKYFSKYIEWNSSLTSGGRSVDIVRSRTKATELCYIEWNNKKRTHTLQMVHHFSRNTAALEEGLFLLILFSNNVVNIARIYNLYFPWSL